MDRREFLKRAGIALAGLTLPNLNVPLPFDQPPSEPPPATLGRIATFGSQIVYRLPSQRSQRVDLKLHDEVIPIYTAILGEPPWPGNPIWYQTDGGFIHSGYVHPCNDTPSDEVISSVGAPGFWSQVCVPIAESRSAPGSTRLFRKLYYGTIYRVVASVQDDQGAWWYQLKEGITWSPGPYVPAWSVQRITYQDLAPISLGRAGKRIEIHIADQRLTCFEGDTPVFEAPISSGAFGGTPRGRYRVLRKRHTSRMTGVSGGGRYDLPGVAFPVYFTPSAIATHGTYWHNDFVRPHSAGCINMRGDDARWVFRWSDPVIPYEEFTIVAPADDATPVIVI